jgi:DNA-binding transcriptional LysR family regulator
MPFRVLHRSSVGTIDIGLLAAFVTIAECRSFTRAAERLGASKSSLSRSIARLEAIVGQALLYRTTRKVTLTAAGTVLLERSATHLQGLRSAVAALTDRSEQPSGVLRVTAANDLGESVLAEVAAAFSTRYPALRLEVSLTVRRVDLVGEGFDAALRPVSTGLESSSLVARRLAPFEGQLFASPAYLKRHGTPLRFEDLAPHAVVQFRNFTQPHRPRPPRRPSLLDLPHRIVADDFAFVRAVLRASAGIGLLPTHLAYQDVVAGTLVRVLPRFATMRGVLYLVHPGGRPVPRKIQVFRDFLLQWFRDRPEWRAAPS